MDSYHTQVLNLGGSLQTSDLWSELIVIFLKNIKYNHVEIEIGHYIKEIASGMGITLLFIVFIFYRISLVT